MSTIISIGAHHDDVELRSGGTLAAYVERGWDVVYAVATTTPHYFPWPDEEESGNYLSNEEIIELRKQECCNAAQVLGITDVNFFDFKSLYWYNQGTMERRYFDGNNLTEDEFTHLNEDLPGREFIVTASNCETSIDFLCGFLKEKKADIVLTHYPDDAHWEHYATAAFVCTAVRKLATNGMDLRLYGWEQGGKGNLTGSFAPTHYVNITETIELKKKSLMSFESQFADHDPSMFAERAEKKAREYGDVAGVEYAEPFIAFQVPAVSQMDVHLPKTYSSENISCGF